MKYQRVLEGINAAESRASSAERRVEAAERESKVLHDELASVKSARASVITTIHQTHTDLVTIHEMVTAQMLVLYNASNKLVKLMEPSLGAP